MARQKTDQWGIQFGVGTNGAGYEWRRLPWVDETRDVLVPVDTIDEPRAGTVVVKGGLVMHQERRGLDVARRAYNEFRHLAETLLQSRPLGEHSRKTERGISQISSQAMRVGTISFEDSCAAIVDYANQFGALWGDDDPRTVREWSREAAGFLDLYDIGRALRTGDFRDFDRWVFEPESEGGARRIMYLRRDRRSARMLTIATEGEILEGKRSANSIAKTDDLFAIAVKGSSRARARMLLTRQINRKMAGGLSLQASLLTEGLAHVAPRQLVHLLYARLWLDVAGNEAIERQMTCLTCGRALQGTKRKKFCDDQCRTEYHNRRRAALR